MKRVFSFILCVILIVSAFSGCRAKNDISSGPGASEFPVPIDKVIIHSKPSGVAVLSPNAADVILALGYETQLKAKSSDCTQSDLSVLPDVTADDADKIKSLGANLVFTDRALTDTQKSAMDKNGITVLTIKSASGRDDLPRLYSEIGSVLMGAKTGYEKGKNMAENVFQTIDDITRAVPESNTPITAVYLYDANGAAVTGDTIQDDLIKAAGLVNSADGGKNREFSMKDLLIADPKYIFCAKGVKAEMEASSDLKRLTAVKENKVYEMDKNLMTLQGDSLINAVSFMAGTGYPELKGNGNSSSEPGSSSGNSGFNTNQTLKSGMKSDDVLKMQNRLQELGYMFIKPTSLFGDGTVQSVKDFQYLNGITVTGVADPATLKKMFSDDAQKRKS